MNREDIIRMARDANLPECHTTHPKALERFAALVAAHEREKVAKWMVERSYATGHGDKVEDLLTEIDWQAAEREREGCAKVCDEAEIRFEELCDKFAYPHDQGMADASHQLAAAIRARREK